jgi:DNA-binding beta-propeller fold protein YncE
MSSEFVLMFGLAGLLLTGRQNGPAAGRAPVGLLVGQGPSPRAAAAVCSKAASPVGDPTAAPPSAGLPPLRRLWRPRPRAARCPSSSRSWASRPAGLRSASGPAHLPAAASSLVLLLGAACGTGSAGARVGEPAAAPPVSAPPAGRVVPVGNRPEGIAVDPSTGVVAVALRSPDAIAVLDPDGRLLRLVAVPAPARHLRFADPSGPLLAPLERSGAVASIDVQDGTILDRVQLQRQPHDAVAVSGRVFVSNEFSDTLAVIASGHVLRELPAPSQPGGVAAAGNSVGVLGVRSHQLEVYSASSLRALGVVPAGEGPTHLEGGADGRLYVADTLGGAVLAFRALPRPALVGRAAAPGRPYGIALDSTRQRLWVTETAANRLAEYDVSAVAPRLLAAVPTVRQPDSVAVDGRTGRVYVTGTADGQLQILQP